MGRGTGSGIDVSDIKGGGRYLGGTCTTRELDNFGTLRKHAPGGFPIFINTETKVFKFFYQSSQDTKLGCVDCIIWNDYCIKLPPLK